MNYNGYENLKEASFEGLKCISYTDLNGKPGFKMAMQVVDHKWYLYVAHLWEPGWSILDVTNPDNPEILKFITGPANTWTIQIQAADSKMITALEKIPKGWGGHSNKPYKSGLIIWDISDPVNPKFLSEYHLDSNGTHRNFYSGGRYIHLAAGAPGFCGYIYIVIDIKDPKNPHEVARWWLPEQKIDENNKDSLDCQISLHGPPYVEGSRAYLPYQKGGMVILDISDLSNIKMISRLDFGPSMGSVLGVHSVVPFTRRNIAVVNTEAINDYADEEYNYTAIVDIKNESKPRIISFFPIPKAPPNKPFDYFLKKGGRFGPHNQHHYQNQSYLMNRDDLIYLTYFNAGLRLYSIEDILHPEEVGHFVPPDPIKRFGLLPKKLVTQTEDVLVDARGYIYITDKNHGIYILKVI